MLNILPDLNANETVYVVKPVHADRINAVEVNYC